MNFNGKLKAITFSYDDGTEQDIRLAELMRKYGIRATFNINSELLGKRGTVVRDGITVPHNKVSENDLRAIYEGHEVASHTLTHPLLIKIADDSEVIRQVEEDRLRLSDLMGYEIEGFAYPGGQPNYDHRVSKLIRENTGVKYARTTVCNNSFDLQDDLFEFKPTAYHNIAFDKLMEIGDSFINLKTETPKILYIWGHAFEFDIKNTWDRFEEFLSMISGHNDIFYGTNREILLAK